MRIDDLTRELRAQAEETRSWPVPAAPAPARTRHRRRDAVLVLVSVVAVAAIVGLPQVIDRDTTAGPGATARPSATPDVAGIPQWHEWTAVRCPSRTHQTCKVPWIIQVFDRQYSSGTGGRQPVFGGTATSRYVSLSLYGPPRGRLVLVGATRSGPGSRVVAQLGDEAPFRVEENLSLVWLPRSPRPLRVSVTEKGALAAKETLVIQEYRPLENAGG